MCVRVFVFLFVSEGVCVLSVCVWVCVCVDVCMSRNLCLSGCLSMCVTLHPSCVCVGRWMHGFTDKRYLSVIVMFSAVVCD